jgi:hypothetical protein
MGTTSSEIGIANVVAEEAEMAMVEAVEGDVNEVAEVHL